MNFLIGHNCGSFPSEKSGGMTVIKILAKKLTKFDCKVYVLNEQYMSENTILIDQQNINSLDKNETVCIYPEIISGNPYGMNNVCRWILYHTTQDIENSWNESDEFFFFWDVFETYNKRDIKILNCFDFKLEQCYNKNYKRNGVCHINKTNRNFLNDNYVKKYNSIDLKKGYFENNFDWLVEEFNKKEMFITEDDSTYFSVIAALCGCISVIYTDKNVDNLVPTHKYAISLNNEISKKNEIELLKNHLKKLELLSEIHIKDFYHFWKKKINQND